MIVVLSEKDDAHVPMVLPKLAARGIAPLWFAASSFPSLAQISVEYGQGGLASSVLRYEGQRYGLSGVTAVWHRRQRRARVDPSVTDESHRAHVELVSAETLEGLWAIIGTRWLPARPHVERVARNKLYHASVAARLGFDLPVTLVTNSPDDFLEFQNRSEEPIISKAASHRDMRRDGEPCTPYTRLVHRRDAFRADLVQYAPVIFQQYVPKQVELRVTVVGQKVFAAEIDSQASRSTRHDWRHYDDPNIQYRVHALPAEMARRCVSLVQALELSFGAIDLIQTPEGGYVFLEINPNGQWAWIENLTGLPISDAIADWLAGIRESDRGEHE